MPIQHLDGLGTESGIDPLDTLLRGFHEQKQTLLGLSEDAEEVGVTLPSLAEGYFSYFAGTVSKRGDIPDGFVSWELPAGEYIVYSFEAESFEFLVMDAIYKAQQYVYNTWPPNHKLQTEAFCAERYASYSPETTTMEIWLNSGLFY